jgi:hypothetical protein
MAVFRKRHAEENVYAFTLSTLCGTGFQPVLLQILHRSLKTFQRPHGLKARARFVNAYLCLCVHSCGVRNRTESN